MRLVTFLTALIGVGLLACSGGAPIQVDSTPNVDEKGDSVVSRSTSAIETEPTLAPTATLAAEPTPAPTAIPVVELTPAPVAVATYSFSTESSSTKLTNEFSTKSKKFGISVAIDGDTIISGNPHDFYEGSDSGSASVFNISNDTWIQQAEITADDIYQGYLFGEAVDIDGDTAVIGATGGAKGAVYVYVLSDGIWNQQAKLVDIATDSSAKFGESVAISGNTVVIGAPNDDAFDTDSGSVFVFTRTGDVWSKSAQLSASGRVYTLSNNKFGESVAIDSDRIYVGALGDFATKGTDSGAVYVFTLSDGTWVEEAKLHASDGAQGDYFGRSISAFNDTLGVGAPGVDEVFPDLGATYIFVRNDIGGWDQETKLLASNGAFEDNFGWSVAVGADVAIVGALYANAPGSDSGSIYTYERTGTTWAERSILAGNDPTTNDRLGTSVAISGNVAVAGAPGYTDVAEPTGAMHVFTAQLR
jgi:hypothetical protein